jgi:hypothetical protein
MVDAEGTRRYLRPCGFTEVQIDEIIADALADEASAGVVTPARTSARNVREHVVTPTPKDLFKISPKLSKEIGNTYGEGKTDESVPAGDQAPAEEEEAPWWVPRMGADGKRELMPKGEHEARLELEDMLATSLVKGPADSGAFYSPSNQICATPLRDATLGSLCAPLGSPASPVTCPADEHTLMDNNMDGAGDDDDTESPDTRHDCEACACRDSACPCLLCCFAVTDKFTAENSAAKDALQSCTRRTSSLHIGRRRFSATQDDRDILLERSLSPDNPFGRTISAPPLRDATPWTLCDPSGSLPTPVTRAAAALVHDLPPHAWVRCVLNA